MHLDPLRLEKRDRLAAAGLDPFAPERYERTHAIAAVRQAGSDEIGSEVSVAGRIVSQRGNFFDIMDLSGQRSPR